MDIVVQAPYLAPDDIDTLAELTSAAGIEPLSRAGNDAVKLHAVATDAGVREACAAAGYDVAFIATPIRLDSIGLVAMDMDSTLITIECIDEIAAHAGIKPQVAAITAAAMRGDIDFAQSLTQRVRLLTNVPASVLDDVYAHALQLSPGATTMLEAFHALGTQSLLVSGGFTFFTDRLQQRLRLSATRANRLRMDDDKLTGELIGAIIDAEAKAAALREYAAVLPPLQQATLAIGDGANDLAMFAAADVSVAYHAQPAVRAQATHAIAHCGLDAILNLFD